MNNSFAHHQKDHRPQPVSSREELVPSLSPSWPLQTQDSSSPFPIPTLSLALPMDWSLRLSIRKASLSVPDEVRMVSSFRWELYRTRSSSGWACQEVATCWTASPVEILPIHPCSVLHFTEDSTGNKDSGQESESIPEYTAEEGGGQPAVEDRGDWRTGAADWHEVIEPYRRVISHGGSGAQNQTRFSAAWHPYQCWCHYTVNIQGTVELCVLFICNSVNTGKPTTQK